MSENIPQQEDNSPKIQIQIPMDELRKRSLFLATPMYGGQCAGMYARSVADLAAACTNYGIKLQMYFLFNESLITRARNYCMDEFDRSDCTHMIFLDSDIGFNPQDVIAMLALSSDDSEFDIMGAPYPKKSLPANAIIETDVGPKNIKWIVDTEYNGKVLTINEITGKLEWNRILTHSKDRGHSSKRWVSLGSHGWKNLKCTDDHELLVSRDILHPTIERVRADQSKGFYVLKKVKKTKGKLNANPLYSDEVVSALIGSLFGDASIGKKKYLRFGHSAKQKDYIQLKQQLFGGKLSEEKKIGSYVTKERYVTEGNAIRVIPGEYKEYTAYFLESPRNAQIEYLRDVFYPEGKKTIKNAISLLDDIGLAYWYMDDGSLHSQNNTPLLCSESFSYEDHVLMQKYFLDKWNIETSITKHGKSWRLRVLKDSSDTFFSIIAKYIPEFMEYKIPPEYRRKEKVYIDKTPLEYAAQYIKDIRYIKPSSMMQYDIGVENNHNFIANGFLVSNCISWEKIKKAVDKGMADNDPNELEKFVGDYVFNPKSGTYQIPIHQPVEVLEIGTGFMMFRKNVLKRFKEAYPHMWYKPDHVRTEHFDGSREIMSYFDCIIDRGYDWTDAHNLLRDLRDGKIPEDKEADVINSFLDREKTHSKRYLSEDYKFCQDANKAGLKIWLCPWMRTMHVGSYVFGGSLADLAHLGASATADVHELQQIKNKKRKA